MRGQLITLYEREKIELFLRGKWSLRRIARSLYRDHSVIVRELKRNTGRDGIYRAQRAENWALQRKSKPHKRKLDLDDVLRNWIIQKMRIGWTPEQVSGQLKNRPDLQVTGSSYVCHETIYSYIYKGSGRFMGLYQLLPRQHKRRYPKRNRKPRKQRGILFMTPIKYRPKEVNERLEFGHWESDSVVSRGSKEAISIQKERLSQFAFITKIPDMTSDSTEAVLRDRIESLPVEAWKSITFDRGGEGAGHYKLRHDYNLETFHCDPYKSYQKGSVENTNGLIRRFYPKGTDFSQVTATDIQHMQNTLNNRPRKILGYKTPHEVFRQLMEQSGALKP